MYSLLEKEKANVYKNISQHKKSDAIREKQHQDVRV